ncbi:MAG: RNA 3'-phosphate cyclase, partial [Candidatus Desulfofervidaceae bacterium]|nr:RNA 3'-phosphate cyclase [Candidatus Desulfofervidaceae bacterium]
MIHIDGSYGEGGGQVLRTSLGLAAVLQKAIRIFNIRAKRSKPGLRPQHLACVQAIQKITKAEVKGAGVGSQELIFIPHGIFPGKYKFDIGTAGSTSLVLQAILLPLSLAQAASTVTIKGGTHVPWSPPFHYLKYIFTSMLALLGVNIELKLLRWGWYPQGQGEIKARVYPANELNSQHWDNPPLFLSLKGLSASVYLPQHIKKRQAERLKTHIEEMGFNLEIEEKEGSGIGQGSFLLLWVDEEIKSGFSALGARGKPAEEVADEVYMAFYSYYKSKVALDEHLGDQIIPYLSLAPGPSSFTTIISSHLVTNIWVINQFLDRNITYT